MASLMSLGQAYKAQSRSLAGDLANREEQRQQFNDQVKQQKQAGTLSLAGTGASIGFMAGGPVGGLIGGAIGLLGGLATNGDLF